MHGLSAAVVTVILNFSAKSCISWLLNSLPLSVRMDFGGPWTLIQQCKNFLQMVDDFLSVIRAAELYLVNRSIMCRYQRFGRISYRSMATTSLKLLASGKQTAGFGGALLNLIHTSQS